MTIKEKNELIELINRLAKVTSSNADYEETHIIDEKGIQILKTFIKGY